MITDDLRAQIIETQDTLIKKQEEHIATLKRIIQLHEETETSLRRIIASYEAVYGK